MAFGYVLRLRISHTHIHTNTHIHTRRRTQVCSRPWAVQRMLTDWGAVVGSQAKWQAAALDQVAVNHSQQQQQSANNNKCMFRRPSAAECASCPKDLQQRVHACVHACVCVCVCILMGNKVEHATIQRCLAF